MTGSFLPPWAEKLFQNGSYLNPFALRTAKTLFTFGHSEYILTILRSERPKLYTVLAILGAKGLSYLNPLHSEWPKLHRVLAFLSAIGL